jgi:hypothetical protein
MRTLLLILALALATDAQAQGYGYGPWPPRHHGSGFGTLGGAVAGGLAGRALAGRRDNTLAVLGGAALGAAAGSALVRPRSWQGAERDALAGMSDRPRALAEVRERLEQHERHRLEHQRLQVAAAATMAEDGTEVAKAQRLLLALGYDPGPLDGISGPRTRAAVMAFEAAQGLPPTGALTPSTVQRMTSALLARASASTGSR